MDLTGIPVPAKSLDKRLSELTPTMTVLAWRHYSPFRSAGEEENAIHLI
jgi:hypothetical protein